MIVGGYTLDLYCDDPKHHGFTLDSGRHLVYLSDGATIDLIDSFVGRTDRECRKQARETGWIFKRDREVVCPFCAKRKEPSHE